MDVKISSDALKIVSLNVEGVSNLKKKMHHFHMVSQKECRRDFFTGNAFK